MPNNIEPFDDFPNGKSGTGSVAWRIFSACVRFYLRAIRVPNPRSTVSLCFALDLSGCASLSLSFPSCFSYVMLRKLLHIWILTEFFSNIWMITKYRTQKLYAYNLSLKFTIETVENFTAKFEFKFMLSKVLYSCRSYRQYYVHEKIFHPSETQNILLHVSWFLDTSSCLLFTFYIIHTYKILFYFIFITNYQLIPLI